MIPLFKKIFSKRNLKEVEKIPKPKKRNRGFEVELKELKEKLSDFLVTQKVQQGLVVNKKNFSLTKNGHALYKLEGVDKNSTQFSIMISTGNHLLLTKENKITGLLQVTEAELNRAIRNEHSNLKSILNNFKNLNLNDKSLELLQEDKKFNWKEILLWDTYFKEMLLLRLKPNTIALLLVSESDSFQKFFIQNSTKKQKRIIADELFYLNQGVNSEESNPNTKNLNLYNFDEAFSELKKKIYEIKKLIDKD
jgi:hypothetical protein